MEKLLIHYAFNDFEVENLQDRKFKAKFINSTLISGPGGGASKGINLGTSGKSKVDITGLGIDIKKFCLQVQFKVNNNVSSRQNIIESNFLPFAVYLLKGERTNTFELVASIGTVKHGWSEVGTKFKKTLQVDKWYTATLVYDMDTLGLFVDDELVSVCGLPNGLIKSNITKKLFFGTWVDGIRNHFNGALAYFKWYNGIPADLESLLDERRSHPEWHITYKHAQIKTRINTGKRTQALKYDSVNGCHTQFYERCGIMFNEAVAFEMHGSIYTKYKAMRNKSVLGYLVTDESKATNSNGRKSLFSKGGIYWSSATGAVPVLGEIYLEYENLNESKALGFPTKSETDVPGGKEQIFQKCRMYYKNGSGRAQEVHGAILNKYLRIGGVQKWGFPITNESDVKKNRRTIGKFSEFEYCTIYWKSGIGAFEVHGSIRKKYKNLNGPCGELGFPASDEVNIPNHSGTGRMNTFEKGSLLWYGSFESIKVARPFKIRLQRIATREDEGWGMGENDIHFYITIKDGNRQLYHKRFPNRGDYGDHNVINPNITFPTQIMPNRVNQRISFSVDIRDSDPGNDDNLGRHTTVLEAANAWGYSQTNGVFNQSFGKTTSFLWSIRPKNNIASLTEVQKWWNFENFKTPQVSRAQYAAAFRDVDSETEWWDISDGLTTLFYKWVLKGIASSGNCFGVSLEAIYARKNNSLLNQPLNEVTGNATVKNEITIKHCYQLGARPVWWFLGQFVTGNTHDPKDVFLETRSAFNRGDNPVVCISRNYDFSGNPHCVMPYNWDTSRKPWKMNIMDPNFPGNKNKVIEVHPDRNTFKYVAKADKIYKGDAWSGGRFHYMPFCVLDTRPRTPVWDAILLILSGTILIIADDTETVSIKDANGKDLNGNGERARKMLKARDNPSEFFASYVGLDSGLNLKPGQLMMRREELTSVTRPGSAVANVSGLPVGTIAAIRNFRGFSSRSLPASTKLRNAIANRSAHHILNDSTVSRNLSADVAGKLKKLIQSNNNRNFNHEVKGRKNGKLEYFIKSGLSEINIQSTIQRNEKNFISVNDLSTNVCKVDFKSPKAKNVILQITNKLGINGDYMTINIANIPIQANKSLELNIKQGLAGLDIVNNGVSTNLPIKITGQFNGKRFNKKFTMPLEGASRVKPSMAMTSDNLLVSKITKIFGNVRTTKIISKD